MAEKAKKLRGIRLACVPVLISFSDNMICFITMHSLQNSYPHINYLCLFHYRAKLYNKKRHAEKVQMKKTYVYFAGSHFMSEFYCSLSIFSSLNVKQCFEE